MQLISRLGTTNGTSHNAAPVQEWANPQTSLAQDAKIQGLPLSSSECNPSVWCPTHHVVSGLPHTQVFSMNFLLSAKCAEPAEPTASRPEGRPPGQAGLPHSLVCHKPLGWTRVLTLVFSCPGQHLLSTGHGPWGLTCSPAFPGACEAGSVSPAGPLQLTCGRSRDTACAARAGGGEAMAHHASWEGARSLAAGRRREPRAHFLPPPPSANQVHCSRVWPRPTRKRP